MGRRMRLMAALCAVVVASAGAAAAYELAGGRWGVVGAVIGAITGGFAPSVYDVLRGRGVRRVGWEELAERSPPRSLARLLDPRLELVRFVGRDGELAELAAWCQNDGASRLRLVTGPGGVGKTRLALELCKRLDELGLATERIGDGAEGTAIGTLRSLTRKRALLVVDYAETRVHLPTMLADLASDSGEGVRVLLLARSTGDWWDRLGAGDPAIWDLVLPARQAQLELSPVIAAEIADAEIVAQAVKSFARELRLPERRVVILGDPGTGQRRVLDLHAAALVAVLEEGSDGTVRVDIRAVLDELLRHEQHYWYDTARARGLFDGRQGATAKTLRQLVAVTCLLGAETHDEAMRLAGRIPGMFPSAKITEWLEGLYPPDPGQPDWVGSVQPDRLAELHVLKEFSVAPGLADGCLTGLNSRQALRAVSILARASSDYPEAENLFRETLPAVADLIAQMDAPADALTAIFDAIPYPTVRLAPAAVSLGQQIARRLPPDSSPSVRAFWQATLGLRLAEIGRAADAVTATGEAVALYRGLAAASPDRYRPELAANLTNLGSWLAEQGQPEAALGPTREAAGLYQDLAGADPDRYRPDLAAALTNLGNWLAELGHPDQALDPTERAATAYRQLAGTGRYQAELATSLDNLGVRLSDLGRPQASLPPTAEAVAIRRELAGRSPDQYGPDLAHSLDNLGVTFSELGRPEEALRPAEEAVALYRQLAASQDRYRADLATSLNNLGVVRSELGDADEALAVTAEAVALYRAPGATPDMYRTDMARALENLGNRLSDLGRADDALGPTTEAVVLYRDLMAARPEAHRPDLARALDNLGITLSELGYPDQALPAAREAVALNREAADRNPDRYLADLATSICNLSATLLESNQAEEARAAAQEAVTIRRKLASADAERFRPDLATALDNLAVALGDLGSLDAALPVIQEAVAIRRELAADDHERHGADLGDSMANLATIQAMLQQGKL